jgi:aldose 1-epimerase
LEADKTNNVEGFMIKKSIFGKLPDGRDVTMFTIFNCHGEYIELLDFGASIHSIFVKDRNGRLGDVLLGVTEAAELAERSLEGTMIGRVGNRISYGKCVIDGKIVQLDTNHNGNFLHGGSGNYAFRMFTANVGENENTVSFYYRDTGEGGFGNNVDAIVHYTFTDDHSLKLRYEMTPEETTILCPTNHAYFNLSDYGDARDHILRVYSENLAKKAHIGVPMGGLQSVKGTPADFTEPRIIWEALGSPPNSFFSDGRILFDDFYVLPNDGYNLAADLYSPKTGRRMKTYTDMQSLILFTPANCSNRRGKRDIAYLDYSGVCLETQFVPNAVNCPEFKSPIFKKGEKLETTTVYAFSVEQ